MNKAIRFLRNAWVTLLLTALACYGITAIGAGPTWATWYVGLYAGMALLALSTIASLGYIAWSSTRRWAATSLRVDELRPTAPVMSAPDNGIHKAA